MRVLLTGAAGMLGSSIANSFRTRRPDVTLTAATRATADLRDPVAVARLVDHERPDVIVHAAARVGGIAAKLAQPAAFLLDNLRIDAAVLGAALDVGVSRVVTIGSAAVYPVDAAQPIPESALLTGTLESANEGYALAKIVSQRLCEYASRERGFAYRTVIPSNLYGPGDKFAPGRAHLVPAALAKVASARRAGNAIVEVWGDGNARREFTYAPDVADFIVGSVDRFHAWPPALNLGAGVDHSVARYYELACEVVGYDGELVFDRSKPSGVASRLLDSTVARGLGWAPSTDVRTGMAATLASMEIAQTEEMT